ncbi:MAG: DUF5682 family protein [Almyronema sp.]
MSVTVFGIRHHGPGSARSLLRSLHSLQPDIVLVEGPPDANDAIALVAHPEIIPPVALLVYAPEQLNQAAFYPFACFSPEWQAMRYGLEQGIPVRFMDLPQACRLALSAAEPNPENKDVAETAPESHQPQRDRPTDPLAWLAEAAGYSDSERWWEHLVEQRQDSTALFDAILAAMSALRQAVEQAHPPNLENFQDWQEALREAAMRQSIRQAQKQGFATIAVVCGAWHAPALSEPLPASKADTALLKGLPKLSVKSTWIPWTYGRLSSSSGYGAGIPSPGWYEHLWQSAAVPHPPNQTVIRWMTQVARLLRQEDLEASSASVIEAVRLAETLAALRESAMPGLTELNEAAQTIFCGGDATPMQLIQRQLIVSDRLGQVPVETPLIPLQQDLQRLQKKLRLQPQANEKLITLDLRKPTDLARSHLLYRLQLLKINWGTLKPISGKGTFKEAWELRWYPELSLNLIEAGHWGNTVADAAAACAQNQAKTATNLAALTALLDQVLLASLPTGVAYLLTRLQSVAAVARDVTHLMAALPPLVNVLRYRDVRQSDQSVVAQVVDGLITRICIGLPGACASLDQDAAAAMLKAINQTDSAIQLLQQESQLKSWLAVLLQLADRPTLPGLVAGRCCRLLLDNGSLSPAEAATRLGLALSLATEPAQAAAWIEGFLQGSALLLIHDDAIWPVLDDWVTQLTPETFTALLPLLRRTFAYFSAAERRQMGERVRLGRLEQAPMASEFDSDRADSVLPLIAQLLGLATSQVAP